MLLSAAPPLPAVAADAAIAGNHPMTGDDQADRVPADCPADRTGRPGRTDEARETAVARDRPEGDLADALENASIPVGSRPEIDRNVVEGTAVPGQELL